MIKRHLTEEDIANINAILTAGSILEETIKKHVTFEDSAWVNNAPYYFQGLIGEAINRIVGLPLDKN